jgi:rhamnulokinase
MSITKYLAFDFGAESGRAIVGLLDGGRLSLEEVHRFPNKPIQVLGHLHWNILSLYEELKKGIALAVQKGHGDIQSIGVDTWGVDFGLIGKNNEFLGFPFTYRDSRTRGAMQKVFEIISRKEIFASTGIQFMQFNSLFQLYSAMINNRELIRVCDRLLFMPDLFNFLLTGISCSEYTIASTSQMLNAERREWDEKIFKRIGMPLNIMAPIIQPGTVIGTLSQDVSKEVGLKREIDVVAVGCHDTASAVAAVPERNDDWAYLSSGTWSLIGVETDRPIINDDSLANDFTNEGGVGNKIRFLRNVMGLWLLQETRKGWYKNGETISYNEMIGLASTTQELKCLVNPDDALFLNPPDMSDAIIQYCRKHHQPIPMSKGEFVRCIFESLALKYKEIIEKIRIITKKKIEKLHIVGGGSQNEMLNQITSDATGIPVIAGPVEATAIGNILVQAIAKGKIESLQEGRKLVADSFQLKTYLPSNPEKWDRVLRIK